MLLPYQPDYKQEQLKVPGTGVCSSSTCNGQHSHQVNFCLFSQHDDDIASLKHDLLKSYFSLKLKNKTKKNEKNKTKKINIEKNKNLIKKRRT